MSEGPIRVVIVDDEHLARTTIRHLLEGEPDVEVIAECGTGAEAIEMLGSEEVDLVFLDVRMPEKHGFDVVEALPSEAPPFVVFVTAYDEHAVRAFEFNAIDYLLKPFDDARFRATLDRARQRVMERRMGALTGELRDLAERLVRANGPTRLSPASPSSAEPGQPTTDDGAAQRVAVRLGKRIEFVDTRAIDWISAEDYYVRLHVGTKSHLLRETMTRLETRLDPTEFVRVHRSAIVRIDRVKQLIPLEHGDGVVVLIDGTEVRVSRTRRRKVLSVLGLDRDLSAG